MKRTTSAPRHSTSAITEPRWVRWSLVAVALGFLLLIVLIPLVLLSTVISIVNPSFCSFENLINPKFEQ